ncbi:hypothetical protein F3J38_21020 [Pantoea sp. Acro-805]|uniref:Uncharacterized protein n=1 Tax=Candidatus Pantoea formicae TaxID=2608355 RepID=A0ABX0QZV6_9GAMM|nr:hypothetical protein [Pantoea formicae]MDF7649999.1 hypothetical protein [Erwiniaceae bacterium L1_54_3]NIF02507.1 hypothetical protein [Pantoea formicae]
MAIYTTDSPESAQNHRDKAIGEISGYPGFCGWLPLQDQKNSHTLADIVLWDCVQSAESAGKAVGNSDAFSGFSQAVKEVTGAGYFNGPVGGIALMLPGNGVEIGRFHLREGVSEEALFSAWTRMTSEYLSGEQGWRGQRLLKLQDGSFIDLAFAVNPAYSQSLCDSWAGNPACAAFLDLIEPVSIEFGTIF